MDPRDDDDAAADAADDDDDAHGGRRASLARARPSARLERQVGEDGGHDEEDGVDVEEDARAGVRVHAVRAAARVRARARAKQLGPDRGEHVRVLRREIVTSHHRGDQPKRSAPNSRGHRFVLLFVLLTFIKVLLPPPLPPFIIRARHTTEREEREEGGWVSRLDISPYHHLTPQGERGGACSGDERDGREGTANTHLASPLCTPSGVGTTDDGDRRRRLRRHAHDGFFGDDDLSH